MLLISPAEPPALRKLGEVSTICEANGVDFLFVDANGAWVGCQRKRVDDLVASIRGDDDRLSRELGQTGALAHAILIVEGDWDWSSAGESRRVRGFTRSQFDGIMVSIQAEYGWMVMHSTSVTDTARLLARLQSWFAKPNHGSLERRPKLKTDGWAHKSSRSWAMRVYQSWDGVGPGLAGAAYDSIGLPLQWACSREELMKALGKTRGARVWETLSDAI